MMSNKTESRMVDTYPNVNSPPVPVAKLKLGVALKFMPVEGPVDEELAPKGALLVLGV